MFNPIVTEMPGSVLVYDPSHNWKPTSGVRFSVQVHFSDSEDRPRPSSLSAVAFTYRDPPYLLISLAPIVLQKDGVSPDLSATLENHTTMLRHQDDLEGAILLGPVQANISTASKEILHVGVELTSEFLVTHLESGNITPIPPRRYPSLVRGFSKWGAQIWILLRSPVTV